jgi:6-phosphogluconolactonase
MIPEIKVLPTPAEIAVEAAERWVEAYAAAVAERGVFTVALSGGSTPKALHAILASESYKARVDWTRVHVFFGDERCVPPDHADSNYRMATETLLSKVPIPPDNVYRMMGEIDPAEAGDRYDQLLNEQFGEAGGLDLCLLGLGDDGHTASLFPHTSALKETTRNAVAHHVEKSTTGQSWRLTLTAAFINRSREVMFLVAGASKAKALATVLEGERNPEQFPAQLILPSNGKLTWLLDIAAAAMDQE